MVRPKTYIKGPTLNGVESYVFRKRRGGRAEVSVYVRDGVAVGLTGFSDHLTDCWLLSNLHVSFRRPKHIVAQVVLLAGLNFEVRWPVPVPGWRP